MKKKLLSSLLVFAFLTSNVFAAWDKAKPTDTELLKNAPAQIRANWQALETGTDSALLITNAKVSATAAIADTKLAQITTAGKVSGAALTTIGSVPSGAGQLPLVNGGTAANLTASNGGLVVSTGSALAIVSGTATAGQIYRSGANTTGAWSTATYPATAGTSGYVLTSDGTNFVSQALPATSPTGSITMWGGALASPPSGWLTCDGSAVSRTTYSALFAVVGTTYGSGDGSTTFNLPNFSNVFPYGANEGSSAGNASVGSRKSNYYNSNLTVSGNDNQVVGTHSSGFGYGSGGAGGLYPGNDMLPPYLAIGFIIKT